MLTDYDLVQELPGQKLHLVPDTNGRITDTAICGRRNHKRGAWQRSLMIDLDFYCICRNCLRVKAARQKKEQQHEHGS
jgi:hypothetical protein